MVLQNGVMQADCLRICRGLSTVLQGPADWWQWGTCQHVALCGCRAKCSCSEKNCAEQCGLLVLCWQSPAQSLCAVFCQLIQASPLCLVQQHSLEYSLTTLIIMNVVIILSLYDCVSLFFSLSLMGKKADVLRRFHKLDKGVKKWKAQKNGRPDERMHTGELEFSMLNI